VLSNSWNSKFWCTLPGTDLCRILFPNWQYPPASIYRRWASKDLHCRPVLTKNYHIIHLRRKTTHILTSDEIRHHVMHYRIYTHTARVSCRFARTQEVVYDPARGRGSVLELALLICPHWYVNLLQNRWLRTTWKQTTDRVITTIITGSSLKWHSLSLKLPQPMTVAVCPAYIDLLVGKHIGCTCLENFTGLSRVRSAISLYWS